MSGPRVCIDCTPLLLRSAGVKTYVYYWVDALRRARGREAVRLFPLLDEIGECVHERSVAGPLRTAAGLALLHAANGTRLPILNVLSGFDVFHASHQLARPPRKQKVTATLYDMTCWLVPEMHSAANVAAAKIFADSVLRRADGLIAISENTKNDAVRLLNLDPAAVRVIYPGVAEAFFGAKPERRAKPYVLFVGTIEPRKNVGTLLDAWDGLRQSIREEYDLVLAGSPGWGDPGVLKRLRENRPGIEYLGYVSEERLPGLTAGATVFVYPSYYEGFGLPVAQAMAAGVPVVTSTVSCLPEVAGEGGLLADPRDAAELGSALEKLLETEGLRRELGARAARRARRYFRWEICAAESWRFFQELAA